MSLTFGSFLLIGLVLLGGIAGQWAGEGWSDLWRYPAAVLICFCLIEGLLARARSPLVTREIGAKIPLGEQAKLTIHVENPERRALHLQSEPRYPGAIVGEVRLRSWAVPPGEVMRHTEFVTPTALGQQDLGALYLRVRGRWGLAWWTQRPYRGPLLDVVPRCLRRQESGIGTTAKGEKPLQRVCAGGLELLAMRDYLPGDPPRSIDWKASARAGKPIVRLYAEERRMDLVLALDAGRGSRLQAGMLTRLNHYINVAARLAETAIVQGDRVALVSFAGERLGTVPLMGGTMGLRRIREYLEHLRSAPNAYNPLAAVLYLRGMLSQRSLVLFFTEISDEELAGQLFDSIRLLVPKHSPMIASLLDESIESMRARDTGHWLDPYRNLAAMEFGQARDNTILHLRRLGAEVIVASPDWLDQAVLKRYQELRRRRRA
jgi:uncharacterized protein (DUF58 family)